MKYRGRHRARDGGKSVADIVSRTWEYEPFTPQRLRTIAGWPRIHDSPDAVTQVLPRVT